MWQFLAAVGAVSGLASMGMGIAGGASARRSAKRAEAAERAARAADATFARMIGQREAEDIRAGAAVVPGAQRAGYAAAGVSVDEGSPIAVMQKTLTEIEKDVYRTVWNSEMRARAIEAGGRVAAENIAAQGKAATWASYTQAVQGAGQAAQNFYLLAKA